MKITLSMKALHQIFCIAMIAMFFVPTFRYQILNTTLTTTSLYMHTTGGNWLISKHAYTWLLIVAPVFLMIVSLIKLSRRTHTECVIAAIWTCALATWAIASELTLMITGIIYIVIQILTLITGLTDNKKPEGT